MNRAVRLFAIVLCVGLLAGATGAYLVRSGALGNLGWVIRERYARSRALTEARLRGDRVMLDLTFVERAGWIGKLDLYLPGEIRSPVPVVVFFHGGGWSTGNRQLASLAATRYRRHGFAVANVSYRRAGEAKAPAAVEDARCAVRWLADHGAQYGIDTSRLVTTGHSAGGHLALMAAMLRADDGFDAGCEGSDARPAAVINWYGPTDLGQLMQSPHRDGFVEDWLGDSAASRTFARAMSPVAYVTGATPPVITIHGGGDDIVPVAQASALHRALDSARVRNRLIIVRGAGHGFDATRSAALSDSAAAFLRFESAVP